MTIDLNGRSKLAGAEEEETSKNRKYKQLLEDLTAGIREMVATEMATFKQEVRQLLKVQPLEESPATCPSVGIETRKKTPSCSKELAVQMEGDAIAQPMVPKENVESLSYTMCSVHSSSPSALELEKLNPLELEQQSSIVLLPTETMPRSLPLPSELDLRTNPFQEGEDDMILARRKNYLICGNELEPEKELVAEDVLVNKPIKPPWSRPWHDDMIMCCIQTRNDLCSLFDAYLLNHGDSMHETNWRMFLAHLRSTSKKNRIKRSSNEEVMQFASEVISDEHLFHSFDDSVQGLTA